MENPLVSIVVVTYNSSKYVLATLKSAKSQTYQNIELIVTDDCSVDDTVEIVKKWISENKNSFKRTELITATINTGVSANCNRGLRAARGEWIKYIAGDDILLNNCIEDNVDYCRHNKIARFIFSFMEIFTGEEKYKSCLAENNYSQNERIKYYKMNSNVQNKELLLNDFCCGPASFIHVETLKRLGTFDETIRGMEDYPMWLRATSKGFKLYFFEKKTVKYRIDHSVSSALSKIASRQVFFKYILFKLLIRDPRQALRLIYSHYNQLRIIRQWIK